MLYAEDIIIKMYTSVNIASKQKKQVKNKDMVANTDTPKVLIDTICDTSWW